MLPFFDFYHFYSFLIAQKRTAPLKLVIDLLHGIVRKLRLSVLVKDTFIVKAAGAVQIFK
jgi:hypothetical protein